MTSPPALTPRARRAVLFVAIGASALDSALLGLIAPLLPEIESRTGASESAVGFALAAYALPIVVLSIPLGRLADRIGRRPLLIGGLVLTAAGSVLIASSESLELLVAGRVIQGLGSVGSWVAALALVSDLAPPGRRGEAIGFALAANGAGAIAGPSLGGITADAIGFAAPFVIVAAIGLVLAAAATLAPIPKHTATLTDGRTLARLRAGLRSRRGLVAAAIAATGAATTGLIEVVIPLEVDDRLGLSASAIGLLFAAAIAVDAALAPFAGKLGDRRGRLTPALVGIAALAVSLALFALDPSTLALVPALGVFGAGLSFAFAAGVPWLDEAFEAADRGLAYGALNLVYASGYFIGPAAGGFLFEHGGPDVAYLAAAGTAALLGAGLVVAARR